MRILHAEATSWEVSPSLGDGLKNFGPSDRVTVLSILPVLPPKSYLRDSQSWAMFPHGGTPSHPSDCAVPSANINHGEFS